MFVFCLVRPTEILEQDVYICESRYQEAERQIRKLVKGIKRGAKVSLNVVEDEIYFFRQPLVAQKVCLCAHIKMY